MHPSRALQVGRCVAWDLDAVIGKLAPDFSSHSDGFRETPCEGFGDHNSEEARPGTPPSPPLPNLCRSGHVLEGECSCKHFDSHREGLPCRTDPVGKLQPGTSKSSCYRPLCAREVTGNTWQISGVMCEPIDADGPCKLPFHCLSVLAKCEMERSTLSSGLNADCVASPALPSPPTPPFPSTNPPCYDSCFRANNGKCEDGTDPNQFWYCSIGTDCIHGSPAPAPRAFDGKCQDGMDPFKFRLCHTGTDCTDCSPPPPEPPFEPPAPLRCEDLQPMTVAANSGLCEDGSVMHIETVWCELGTDCSWAQSRAHRRPIRRPRSLWHAATLAKALMNICANMIRWSASHPTLYPCTLYHALKFIISAATRWSASHPPLYPVPCTQPPHLGVHSMIHHTPSPVPCTLHSSSSSRPQFDGPPHTLPCTLYPVCRLILSALIRWSTSMALSFWLIVVFCRLGLWSG